MGRGQAHLEGDGPGLATAQPAHHLGADPDARARAAPAGQREAAGAEGAAVAWTTELEPPGAAAGPAPSRWPTGDDEHQRQPEPAQLKPANVMSDRGFAKVIDFSHARCPGRAVRGRGTRAYMAPEQARGGRVGPPADVWGLGATLYAACVGRAPFPGGDGQRYPQFDGVAAHVAAQRRLPRASAPLGELIAACLTADARRRPTVAQVANALDALLVVS